ncbi:hypothetical protein [Nostoc sp.]|uniref:hypothetical protein n=1 Tax=Nostoc sp. TaxID=1180 RepID=UPI002FFCE429
MSPIAVFAKFDGRSLLLDWFGRAIAIGFCGGAIASVFYFPSDEKESKVRIQESEYPMSEVRGFKP